MTFFLIGIGVGSLTIASIHYIEKYHQGPIPSKYIFVIGIVALLAGLVVLLY